MRKIFIAVCLMLNMTVLANGAYAQNYVNIPTIKLAARTEAQICRDSGGVPTSGAFGDKCIGGNDQNPIFDMLSIFLTFFVSAFGLAMVAILVWAGIRYITSAGSPDDVKEAKNLIKAVITALILFAIMFAVLRIILPEGIGIFR